MKIKWYRPKNWLIVLPFLIMAVFFILVLGVLFYFKKMEHNEKMALIYRDLPSINQNISWRFKNQTEEVKHILQAAQPFSYDKTILKNLLSRFKNQYEEVDAIYYFNGRQEMDWFVDSSRVESTNKNDVLHQAFYPNDGEKSIFIKRNLEQVRKNKVVYDLLSFEYNHVDNAIQSGNASENHAQDQQQYIVSYIPVAYHEDVVGIIALVYKSSVVFDRFIEYSFFKRYTVEVFDAKNQNWYLSTPQHPFNENIQDEQPSHELPLLILPQLKIKIIRHIQTDSLLRYLFGVSMFFICLFMIWILWILARYLKKNQEQQSLLANEVAFRRALGDSTLVGICAMDDQKSIHYVNPAFCQMTGLHKSTLLGMRMPFSFWVPEEYSTLPDDMLFHYGEIRFPQGIERRIRHKAGHFLHVKMYVSALMQGAQHTGWLISMIDMSESRRAREEADATHQRFLTVLASLDAAVSVLGTEKSELLFSNPYYLTHFGKSKDAHVELTQTSRQLPELTVYDWMNQILPKLHSEKIEEVYYEPQQRWFNVRKRSIQWVDGRLAQMMIALDITTMKQSQEQARTNETRWHFANRLSNLGEMASSFAHELNQPLSAISNYCQGALARLKTENIAPDILKAIEKASAQALKAGDILHKLRQFIKKDYAEKKLSDLMPIVMDAIALVELSIPEAKGRILPFFTSHLPLVLMDKILIEQVLVNLIKNAVESNVQAMQKDGRLRQVQVRLFSQNQMVYIWVMDQGVGVEESAQERIFEAFFSSKAQGMGMGLKICHSIIEHHQGRLWVENNQKEGATFKVSLPLNI